MEIIGIIIFIYIVWKLIAENVEKYRQQIRDDVAHKVLDNSFNFEKEKEEILKINRNLHFIKIERKCPLCNSILVERHGIYGAFLGCTNYPNCKFTKKKIMQTPTIDLADNFETEE